MQYIAEKRGAETWVIPEAYAGQYRAMGFSMRDSRPDLELATVAQPTLLSEAPKATTVASGPAPLPSRGSVPLPPKLEGPSRELLSQRRKRR